MKLIEKLRKSTRDQHTKLDQISEMKRLTSDSVEVNDYKNYLQAFYSIYCNIEDDIYNYASQYLEEINLNQRKPYLISDLKQLESDYSSLVIKSKLQLNDKEYLGALYVMEGSRLGGNLIGKHLLNHSDLEESNLEFLFFPASVKWSQIISFLNEQPAEDHVEIIAGAQKTFKYFYEELSNFYKGLR